MRHTTSIPFAWRLLLRLLPARFRARYGADMTTAFLDRRDDASATGGHPAVFRLWWRTAHDLARAGAAERWRSSLDSAVVTRAVQAAGDPRPRRSLMLGWLQDARFSGRLLRRQPAYAFFLVLTLVVGIGANVTVFSVVNAVLLKPLPYADADRLVAVWSRFLPESGFEFDRFSLSAPEFVDYATSSQAIESAAAWYYGTATVGADEGRPERLVAGVVTPSLFDVLRTGPQLGRTFTSEEGLPGGPSVIVLSHGYWQSRFGGAPDVLGRRMDVNGTSRTIIGVMPASFDYPADARLWSPLRIDPASPGNRQSHSLVAIARLTPDATRASADAELETMMAQWKVEWPDIHTGHFLYLQPLLDDTVGSVKPVLTALLGATTFLLLIVCANIGSMVLARGEGRVREMAIRAALGADRRRLVRLTLIESLMVAAVGCVGGVGLAMGGVRWLRSLEDINLPRLAEVSVDWQVTAFAVATSLAAAVAFGVVPALRGASTRVQAALRDDARTSSGGRLRVRRLLVGTEVALAVMLVVGASLMARSLTSLMAVDPGFQPDRVMLATVSLPPASYPEADPVETFFTQLVERVGALPGVARVAASTTVPLTRSIGQWDFEIEGQPPPADGQARWNAAIGVATPGFFEAIGARIVRGRALADTDRRGTEPVVVVTEALARKFFGESDPVGARIRVVGDQRVWMTVVGVVGDMRDQALDAEPRPMYFVTHSQSPETTGSPGRTMTIAMRAAAGADGPESLVAGLRTVVQALDPAIPLYGVTTYADAIGGSIARPRFTSMLFAVFASIGLILGAIGIYGVLAYTVAERTREIGIRRALGAPAGRLARLILRQGMAPVVAGVVVGLGLALAGSRYLESMLFGVSTSDPSTYVGVAAGVLVTALLACLAPIRRALGVSPSVALTEQ